MHMCVTNTRQNANYAFFNKYYLIFFDKYLLITPLFIECLFQCRRNSSLMLVVYMLISCDDMICFHDEINKID